jgi:hypothetical protein
MPRKPKEPTAADRIHAAVRNGVPPHIQPFRWQPSAIAKALEPSGDVNWNRAFCRETGEPIEHPNRGAGRIAANQRREQEAQERALDVRERYGDLFDRCDGPSKIARLEGVDPRTVRRWRAKLKKNGQA